MQHSVFGNLLFNGKDYKPRSGALCHQPLTIYVYFAENPNQLNRIEWS